MRLTTRGPQAWPGVPLLTLSAPSTQLVSPEVVSWQARGKEKADQLQVVHLAQLPRRLALFLCKGPVPSRSEVPRQASRPSINPVPYTTLKAHSHPPSTFLLNP
jgi:hypothetical protein